MWVRERNRAFILEFWVICNFFPVSGNSLPFWSHIPLPHPRHPQYTMWNSTLEIFSSKYILVWVRELNGAFLLDFRVKCDFFPVSGHFLLFWSQIPLPHPRHPQHTIGNTPLEIFFSKYVLMWVGEQNRAFIMDLWVICDFSPMGGHFLPFLVTHTPSTPPDTLKILYGILL